MKVSLTSTTAKLSVSGRNRERCPSRANVRRSTGPGHGASFQTHRIRVNPKGMTTYVWDRNAQRLIEKAEALVRSAVAPNLHMDIEPYPSPITGETISGRAARREDMHRSGSVDPREFKGMKFKGPLGEARYNGEA